jgi:hypothetical protein
MDIVWLEGLGKLKRSADFIGNKALGLSAYNIVPHPKKIISET